jgi:hypothetical protein
VRDASVVSLPFVSHLLGKLNVSCPPCEPFLLISLSVNVFMYKSHSRSGKSAKELKEFQPATRTASARPEPTTTACVSRRAVVPVLSFEEIQEYK